MELLDGTELKDKVEDEKEGKAIGWQEREEIEEKKMKRAIKKLKKSNRNRWNSDGGMELRE